MAKCKYFLCFIPCFALLITACRPSSVDNPTHVSNSQKGDNMIVVEGNFHQPHAVENKVGRSHKRDNLSPIA